MTPIATDNAMTRFATRVLGIERREFTAVLWSFVYFFCILSAYYMLRPVRDAMAIVGGTDNIPWLFTGTFVAMTASTLAFGWVASRYSRRTFLPWVYCFFIVNLLLFFVTFRWRLTNELGTVWVARTFFVWISVFNLFVVSVFWSFMVDIYSQAQSRRLFGIISAGGSAGALLGPLVTSVLVRPLGFANMLPLSALLLGFAVYCVFRLRRWASGAEPRNSGSPERSERPLGGTAIAGIRMVLASPYLTAISIAMFFASFLGLTMYTYLAELVSANYAGTDRQTQVFAHLDALINGFSLIGQLLIVKHSVRRLGIGMTLAILPLVSVIGFALLAANPVFAVIAVFQVVRRSITFGLTKPTSDMLYAVVPLEAKYKAKNFIDTVVYRASDVVSVWIVRLLAGIGLSGVSLVCIVLGIAWSALAFWIGRGYRRQDESQVEGAIA